MASPAMPHHLKRSDGNTVAAFGGVAEAEGPHVTVLFQIGVNDGAENPFALAVNDANMRDALLLAFFEVVRDQRLDLGGTKSVQVEGAVNGEVDRFVLIHGDAVRP